MSRFIGVLLLRSLSIEEVRKAGSSVQLYEVMQEISYESDRLKRTITVPAGLITDFASIPRPAWRVISPTDPIIEWPSVVHDWLYTAQIVPRASADAVLREAMELQGAGSFVRNGVYQILRLFGGSHWDEKSESS